MEDLLYVKIFYKPVGHQKPSNISDKE